MGEYLLRVEGVNLGNVLDDTNQLSVVRGAGLLLLDAPINIKDEFNNLKSISTGASAGLFCFGATDDKAAQAKVDNIAQWLSADEKYRHFTFVVDYLPVGASFVVDKERLLAVNRIRQMQSLDISLTVLFDCNSHDVCEIDNLRPSAEGRKINQSQVVSESVYHRFEFGRKERKGILAEYGGYKGKNTDNLEDLSDSKRHGNLNNKIALIYLDGNKFGNIGRSAGDKMAMIAWDNHLKELKNSWLKQLVNDIKSDADWYNHDELRLEVLLWGGDEIMLVVPAWRGLWTLAHFFDFSRSWRDHNGQERLTHAAGIVFSHHKTPIKRLKNLAYELVDEVKSTLPSESKSQENCWSYLTLESVDFPAISLDVFRKEYYPTITYPKALLPLPLASAIPAVGDATALANLIANSEVSRKQLYGVVRALLRYPEKYDETLERFKQVDSDGYLKAEQHLRQWPGLTDANRLNWLILNELWDYLDPEYVTPKSKEVN